MRAILSSSLVEQLKEYRASLFLGGKRNRASELQAELARIPDETTRNGALERFRMLLVCSTVMKLDPDNYHRAVGNAFENLVQYLEHRARDGERKGREADVVKTTPASSRLESAAAPVLPAVSPASAAVNP